MDKITVLVADSQRLFSECLAGMLDRFDSLWVLEEFPNNAHDAIRVAETWTPDVTLLDYWIPGMDVRVAIRSMTQRDPAAKVLVLSWFHGPDQIQGALDAGAAGYLPKSIDLASVVVAIEAAHRGESPVFVEQLGHLIQHLSEKSDEAAKIARRFEQLTHREREILIMLSQGRPIDELAEELSISPHTLKTHIRNILGKTGARSHSEAVAMALRAGLIQI